MSYKSLFRIQEHHRLFEYANCPGNYPGNIKRTPAAFHLPMNEPSDGVIDEPF
jgi:hypothetical protein